MNYDYINDIFAAGVTNMTCLLQDSNNYDGGTLAVSGADFFTFLGKAAPSIYAHGDSYWGIGSDTTHLKIDNRDTRMRSLYREEGTLYSYYRFLKIRWEGWSHYNASGADYQLKYDLVFWDTGDISLHMISIPIQCYDGAFGFTADKNYTFTKPDADSPDITFQYYAESKTFEIKYTLLDLLVPFKLLVRDDTGKLYTVETQIMNEETDEKEDVLVELEETNLSALLFKKKGFDKMPEWDLIKHLEGPAVLSWSDSRAFPLNAIITGTPPKQYIEGMADLSDGTVLGIKALNAEYTGTVTVQYSYDGENFTEELAMEEFLLMDLDALYAGLLDAKTITFRFWLAGDATLASFVMNYRNGDDDNA
nr:MAG TPA: hypothetical protein [Caudoviricetes sp.]